MYKIWGFHESEVSYYGVQGYDTGTRDSVVGWDTMLQAGRSPVRIPDEVDFFPIYLILPAALWPWVDSASNKNEYQESSWG
jgi:hypothetical protein